MFMLYILSGFAEKTFKLLENLTTELKEVKALLLTTRPAGTQSRLDFSQIPKLPLDTKQQIEDLEKWLALDANNALLVI